MKMKPKVDPDAAYILRLDNVSHPGASHIVLYQSYLTNRT